MFGQRRVYLSRYLYNKIELEGIEILFVARAHFFACQRTHTHTYICNTNDKLWKERLGTLCVETDSCNECFLWIHWLTDWLADRLIFNDSRAYICIRAYVHVYVRVCACDIGIGRERYRKRKRAQMESNVYVPRAKNEGCSNKLVTTGYFSIPSLKKLYFPKEVTRSIIWE